MRRLPILLLSFPLAIAGCLGGGERAPTPPPKIALILVDTFRSDYIASLGGPVPTPNLDRFVAEAATAPNAAGSFHQTTMSMGALFAGATPSLESGDRIRPLEWNGSTWCGLARFGTGDAQSECLPRSRRTIVEKLKAAGYETAGVMSNELLFRPAGFDRGFDIWREVGGAEPRDAATNRVEWANRARAARGAGPVIEAALEALDDLDGPRSFLYVHFMDAHDWFTPKNPARSMKEIGNYGRAVQSFDAEFGRFLQELDDRGWNDDAVVILASDHGEALNEPHPVEAFPTHLGNPSYQTVLRVPFAVGPPRYFDASAAEGRIWRSEDVHRWLARLVGEDPGENGPLEDDEVFVTERLFQTLLRGTWKYSRSRRERIRLLFDLEADPGETRNVAGARPRIVEEFERRLDELSQTLASAPAGAAELSTRDAERLRALGYLE
jgi:arylsulfatase A-like enzyme